MLPTARANRDSRLSFVTGDCFNLPVRNESCDVVWGSLVLSHLPNLEGAIAEIRRVLKPEGLYLGFEPNPFNLVIIYRLLFRNHSRNEYLLTPGDLKVFREQGFDLRITYFYSKFPTLRNRLLTTCLGIRARKA
jgi:ubiquinone/menaquinone biosynthesis C-methylase UbiE